MKKSIVLVLTLLLFVWIGNPGNVVVRDQLTLDSAEINHLKIDTISASVKVTTADVDNIKIELTGNIRINEGDPNAEFFLEANRQGKTVTVQPQLKNGKVNSYSGAMEITVVMPTNLETLTVTTVSGDIDVLDFMGESYLESVSGNIYVKNINQIPNALNAESVSGRIEALLPNKAGFHLSVSTVSGRLHIGFPVTVSGNKFSGPVNRGGSTQVKLNTVSGSIVVTGI